MTTVEQAFLSTVGMSVSEGIEKARRAGWEARREDWEWSANEDAKKTYRTSIFLDPSFWRALGVSEGKTGDTCSHCGKGCMRIYDNESSDCCHNFVQENYVYKMHRFLDTLVDLSSKSESK